jgi:Spy/CpxP family protein refolding chaperone
VKKTRVEALLIVLTVLALSAGVVAGLVAARLPASSAGKGENAPPPPPMPPGPTEKSLADELQLNPDQREQMRGIWEGVRDKVHKAFDEAQDLQRQRDERFAAILTTDEQRAQFQKISKEFADRYDQLARDRDEAFNSAVEKTRKLLNETQRKKYEEILKSHVRPGPPGAGGGKMFIAPGAAPSTRPSR